MFRRGFVLVCVGVVGVEGSVRAVAEPVVLEAAEMGTPGRIGGNSVSTAQWIGWRFQTDELLAVRRIGAHLLSYTDVPGELFAALVRLDSITAVPHGAPFTEDEVVATTLIHGPFPSAEAFVPMSATLEPGAYTLVFGTGLFGATGEGALHNGPDQPDIPPTNLSSFIYWSRPGAGLPMEWRLNLASHMRVVIEAESIDLVGDYNANGSVDTADYAVWREHEGTTDVLANDLIGGQIGAEHYAQWRAHFGETSSGAGAAVDAAVPEPGLAMLVAGAWVTIFAGRRLARFDVTLSA